MAHLHDLWLPPVPLDFAQHPETAHIESVSTKFHIEGGGE